MLSENAGLGRCGERNWSFFEISAKSQQSSRRAFSTAGCDPATYKYQLDRIKKNKLSQNRPQHPSPLFSFTSAQDVVETNYTRPTNNTTTLSAHTSLLHTHTTPLRHPPTNIRLYPGLANFNNRGSIGILMTKLSI